MKNKHAKASLQTKEFETESLRYVSAYLDSQHNPYSFFPKSIVGEVQNILDVGCGNGEFLFAWKKHYKAAHAIGVEPSKKAVELLRTKWKEEIGKNPAINKTGGLEFKAAYAQRLPFKTDSFDIVTVWSVLHWIGRNEYLQSLGELIQVCKKYLVIMDFVGQRDYRTPYSHKAGLFTYKQDFEKIIKNSGTMRSIEKNRWFVDPTTEDLCFIDKAQLNPFEKTINYHSRKMVVFQKDYEALLVKSEGDFG